MKIQDLPTAPEMAPEPRLGYSEYLRYQDLMHGIIRIDESIRESSAARILSEISDIKRRQLPEATFIISSPGGGAYYALALYDSMRALSSAGTKVNAIVEGWAASAACMIVLQAADKRRARPNARFLLHEMRRWIFFAVERTSDIKDEVKEMDALSERIIAILARRCKRTRSEVRNLIERKEVWMSASEAKEWGLIDQII